MVMPVNYIRAGIVSPLMKPARSCDDSIAI
jgi:hypothetical protein